jgi:RNA polymerase sigma-70 factor, ECF subfamily
MPVPPAAAFSLGMLVPGKRFASWVDPRTPSLAFQRLQWADSMLIQMVHRGRISFHRETNSPTLYRLRRIVSLVPFGRGCRIAATWARCEAIGLQFHNFDEAYLERLCSGDFRTESHFVTYFSELIQLKLRSRVNSPQTIEDLRQETFARVFVALRGQGRLRQPERLGAFVNSVCNNVLLEHYRSSSRENPIEDEDSSNVPDPSLDVVSILSHKEMELKVRQVLEELSERDRRLLREIFLEERDKDAVCQDFGVDRDYLRVLLHRAKQAFKAVYLKNMPPDIRGTAAD